MKICFVTEHYPPHVGGVEIAFFEYANRLAGRGNETRVITSASGGVSGLTRENGVDVFRYQGASAFGHPIIRSADIRDHVEWADIVHTTTFTAAPPTRKLCRELKKPCLLMVPEVLRFRWFGIEHNPLKAAGFFLFERWVIGKKYFGWHVISEATKKDLRRFGIGDRRIFKIYPIVDSGIWNPAVRPLDLPSFFGFDFPDEIFLYTGRPGKTKGVFLLLKSIGNIRRELEKSRFRFGFILSREPRKERERFEREVRKADLDHLVRVRDAVPFADLPRYRKSAAAVIVPSLTEGFGFVAAETAALGVPLIVSSAGSLPEVVSGRVLSFKSGSAEDLAEKIGLAMEGRFPVAAKKNFDGNQAVFQLEEIYKEMQKAAESGRF